MIHEYDIVELIRDIPSENVTAGMKGIVVMVYNEPNMPEGYEVEFIDKTGATIALITLKKEDLLTSSDK